MSRGRNPEGRAGYVLLELLAVMLILGIAVTTGATALARREVAATPIEVAKQMQGVMLRARAEAMRTGLDATVSIDAGNGHLIYDSAATPLPAGPQVSVRGQRPSAGSDVARIVFRSDGSASGADIRVAHRGRAARLEVSWLTGLPRIREEAPR